MARITYRTRLQDLLAKPYLPSGERRFAQSLLDHYNRKGYMSAGRARCVRQMEERYATAPVVNSNLVAELDNLRNRIEAGNPGYEASWDHNFVKSLTEQAQAGRDLSERQKEILEKLKGRWSEEATASAAAWRTGFTSEQRERFNVMVDYYATSGYYGSIVEASKSNPSFTPTEKQYRAVTENKYAMKILAGWEGAQKYATGSMVAVRKGAPMALRLACGGNAAPNPVVIVGANTRAPTSACRGNKIYKVLPVGNAQTFEVEERHLKRVPASITKRKKKRA